MQNIRQCQTQHLKSSCFKLAHLNIRSLRNTAHLIQIKEFILKTKAEVLTLSETWLNTTIMNAEISIVGYALYRQDRLNKRGGGVCAYIRNDIKVSKLKEISSVSENYFHQLWLKLQSKKLKSIVICISYRPPQCPLSCLETNLKPSVVQALLLNKPIVILGDLNCNVMKDCPENTALGNFMLEMNPNQLITTPTRITDTSESLIDVIITSTTHLVNESGVMNTIISDHLPVYAVLDMKLPKPSPQYMLTRSYKDYDCEKFSAHLSLRSEELISIFSESNVNSKLDKFNDVLLTTLAVHAPVRITKTRYR